MGGSKSSSKTKVYNTKHSHQKKKNHKETTQLYIVRNQKSEQLSPQLAEGRKIIKIREKNRQHIYEREKMKPKPCSFFFLLFNYICILSKTLFFEKISQIDKSLDWHEKKQRILKLIKLGMKKGTLLLTLTEIKRTVRKYYGQLCATN